MMINFEFRVMYIHFHEEEDPRIIQFLLRNYSLLFIMLSHEIKYAFYRKKMKHVLSSCLISRKWEILVRLFRFLETKVRYQYFCTQKKPPKRTSEFKSEMRLPFTTKWYASIIPVKKTIQIVSEVRYELLIGGGGRKYSCKNVGIPIWSASRI